MIEQPTTIALTEAFDPAIAGSKAASLAKLLSAGESVPCGFVITLNAATELDSPAVQLEIGTALAALDSEFVAVRSSAAAEDLADMSYAGQYDSFLNVPSNTAAVLAAANRVVDSADGAPIAVLVQSMVDAQSAGALFSANPVTGDTEVVISAVTGLAADLMAGSVTGEQFVVAEGRLAGQAGVLSDTLVADLASTAVRLAASAGHPVDIEWAFDGETIQIVQCRPITALPVRPTLEMPDGSWQKDATHHPAPMSPLAASHLGDEEEIVARWMERSGLILEGLKQVSLGGEVYVQPVPVGGGGSGKAPPRFVMGIVVRLHPGLRARMKNAKTFIESGALENAPYRWNEEWKPELIEGVTKLRAVDVESLTDDELVTHINDVVGFSARAVEIHFDLFLPYLVAIHEFVGACHRMLGWDDAQVMGLFSGHSPASAEPTVAMRDVADVISNSPAAVAALDGPVGTIVERVSNADPVAGAAIADWVDMYGFRASQYDWSSLTIGEQPGLVGLLLRSAVEHEAVEPDHSGSEATAKEQLSASDADEFDSLLERAQALYPIREDNIPWTSSAPGALMRRAYVEIGQRLVRKGVLADADDVFMLEREEVLATFNGTGGAMHDLVRRRRAERAWVAAHPGPAYLGDPPSDPPDIGAFPEAGRRLNEALLWAVGAEFTEVKTTDRDDAFVSGIPGASGVHTGTARIVRSETDFARVELGDVVVCPITNPAWSVLFGIAGAFVCDAGGPLSHTAILTREYAIPSVLATRDATTKITDGMLITVDGAAGTVVAA